MINKISIENFKIFKDNIDFENLKNINFLTGVNGRGKSTFLQTLIAIAQSIRENGNLNLLCLNGDMIKLGNAIDVKNEDLSRERDLILGFVHDNDNYELVFNFKKDNDQVLGLKEFKINSILTSNNKVIEHFIDIFNKIIYISAERIGPKLHYDFCNDSSYIDPRGEYVACAYYNHKDDIISEDFIDNIPDIFPEINPDDIDHSFAGQVQFWLSQMFRPTYIKAEYVASVNEYVLQFGAPDRTGKYKPTNVGFGYTYALPIVVAALLARPNTILIVENPEAHLHPLAQSILSKFLTLISKRGVQIFIETHSEHIINASRVLIVQEAFEAENMRIFYFDEKYVPKYISIPILPNGRIVEWPQGFFDQSEIDNDIILGL